MKNKTILILGAGQIGEACAIRALKEKPKKIILHTLTKDEATLALNNVKKRLQGCDTEMAVSWGDALVTRGLMGLDKNGLHEKENRKILIDYYYSYLSDELIEKSSLYYLVEKWRPDIIIDGINTATVVGYQDDPYSLPRKVLKNANQDWKESTENILVSNIIPSLIRFTQALKKAMTDYNTACYVKISTTGLGGMGDNLLYTHGDVNEPGMSSGILGKVAAAGVIHQLFWSLSHTPGINIKVVVPAALVGWQGVYFGKFRSHGKSLPLLDSTKREKLIENTELKPGICEKIADYSEMPYVDSGENCAYSAGEMTAITTVGQMECITKEEVAEAVIESIYGSTKRDLLTIMDYAAMGPSHVAAVQREVILSKMHELEVEKGIDSIATNNLGPTVSKHLFELFLIMKACDNSPEACVKTDLSELVRKVENIIMGDQKVRAQIVSLGLPIIFDNEEVIIGDHFYVPNELDTKISKEKVDLWASAGWVDLRKAEISYWQEIVKKILDEAALFEDGEIAILDRNWKNIKNGNIGELLGYAYSISGGERRTNFTNHD